MLFSLFVCFSLSADRYESGTLSCPDSAAFSFCSSLEDDKDASKVIEIDGTSLTISEGRYACCTQGVANEIKISVASIPNEAFYGSTKLRKVTLTADVTSIGDGAFCGCTNLDLSVSFNSALNSIGNGAFQGCIKLNGDVSFSGGSIGDYAFSDCSNLNGALKLTPRTGNTAVTSQTIGERAFEGTHITSLTPGSALSRVNDYAFLSTDLGGDITFPDTLASIGTGAFKNTGITGVTFPNHATRTYSIGERAFDNTKISKTLTITDGCNNLGSYAFARIPYTGTVSIGDRIRSIPAYLFYNSSITRVTAPGGADGVNSFHKYCTSIGAHAFDYSHLTGPINFGTYLKTIETYAFRSTGISGQLVLPESLTEVDEFAFYECSSLTGPITIPYVLSTIKESAFEGTGLNGALTIPDTVTTFEKRAFARTKFTELNLHLSKSIPEAAFEGITSTITKLCISVSSKATDELTIKKYAFKDCTISGIFEIEGIIVDKDAFLSGKFTNTTGVVFIENCLINSYAFRSFEITGGVLNLTDSNIADNGFETLLGQPRVVFHHVIDRDDPNDNTVDPVYIIGQYAFYNTRIQGNLDIPNHIFYVGPYAFAYCRGLTGSLSINASGVFDHAFYESGFASSLSLGSQVASINAAIDPGTGKIVDALDKVTPVNTFTGCKFNQITLSEFEGGLTIPRKAFYQMTTITNPLYIPVKVGSIGEEAFSGCTGISRLEFEADPSSINGELDLGDAAFMGCTGISNELVINRALTDAEINRYAFCECTKIPSLNFDTKLTTIGYSAFYHCIGLRSVSFPIELTTINGRAFGDCTSLAGNLVLHHPTTIGPGAFMNCAGLTGDLDLSSVTEIGGSAFYGCTGFDGILSLYNPSYGGTYSAKIYSSAFERCSNLKGTLDLRHFDEVGARAFYDCSSLDGNLTILRNEIEDYTFYHCSSLKGPLAIGASTIGKYAFYGCSGFSGEFVLPDDISSIGEYAFAGCSGLTGPLEFPGTINFIGKGAFSGCKGFSDHLSIQVGDSGSNSFLRIDERAFEDCNGFKNGDLTIYIDNDETVDHTSSPNQFTHYRYPYFLRIQNKAFDGTKFKNIYYNGRFQPDCDYDIGISSIKGIHTSSNYANKTFCGNPIHSSKLSGGAIAGIVIACIVVVAAIVALIIFLIIRNKKNKDNSEGEVEMNNNP